MTIVREAVTSLRKEVPILREAVTSLQEEVRSELQSFYERISTLIELSSAHLAPAPSPATAPTTAPAPATAPTPAPATATAPSTTVASTLPLPPPSPPPQAEKEADIPNHTAHTAADTPALAADPPIDMVYLF